MEKMPEVNGDCQKDENGSVHSGISPYEEAMEALSSLITKRSRADKSSKGGNFSIMFDYVKILELDEAIKEMKIIHVAGTKGKGSTCTFSESILRHCGFRTGLFTSPHLIDVRERFKLDGSDISEEKFLEYFWWCFNLFKKNVSEELPMPTYFRFLALLAFKIFAAEKVDVAILEVGLGGKFDATNIVENPIVCGIASLGYDHMEILGNTLGQIAGEKAGIFKRACPAFTVPQPQEAMAVLEKKAAELDVNLQVTASLDPSLMSNMRLGLEGEHQYLNAGLAVALCSTWLQRTAHAGIHSYNMTGSLPEEFIRGLASACLQGRAQIVADQFIEGENPGGLVFYLDGAHSPESMDVCAKWFCNATKGDTRTAYKIAPDGSNASLQWKLNGGSNKASTQILLFNCMSVRDPKMLLPRLMRTCANHGVHFNKAIFVPNTSLYHKVGNATSTAPSDAQVDVSWQRTLQRVWEGLAPGEKGTPSVNSTCKAAPATTGDNDSGSTTIFSSLPQAISWLRDSIRRNQSARFQVLVTGSLHLVGDVLRLIRK